jgi:hypothetical protein
MINLKKKIGLFNSNNTLFSYFAAAAFSFWWGTTKSSRVQHCFANKCFASSCSCCVFLAKQVGHHQKFATAATTTSREAATTKKMACCCFGTFGGCSEAATKGKREANNASLKSEANVAREILL